MNKPMRRGAKTKELALALAIEQMANVEVVGVVISAHDAKLRHVAASNAMARSNAESRALMSRLRGNRKVEPLSAEQLSTLIYPGRRYQ